MKIRTLVQVLNCNRGSIVEERDADELAAEAYREMEAEKKGEVIPKKEEPKPEVEGDSEGKTPEADPNLPDIEVVGAPDEEESEEEETEEGEAKPEEEAESESETQVLKDEEITEYAEKHSMTYAEAKEDLEKTNKIIEQFKNDPKEMARALRNKDREYDKLKNEKEKKEKPKVFQKLNEDQFKNTAQAQIDKDPDKFLDAYKKRYPAKSELMSDEAIVEEIIDREWGTYQTYAVEEEKKIQKKALDTREKIISGIPKQDIRFLPDVKAVLEQIPDNDLLDPEFDSSWLLELAKGKRYDADIKAAREQASKQAKDGAKIIGVKNGSGKQGATTNTQRTSLNHEQKARALDMFPFDDGYTEEKAYAEFADVYKDELKKDPHFVG